MRKLMTLILTLTFFALILLANCKPKTPIETTTTTTIQETTTSTTSTTIPIKELKVISAKLNEEFELKMNQIANIESENIKIKFLNMLEDSRCPSGVQCVWQGQARIQINIEKNNNNLGDFILTSLAGKEDISIKDFDGYIIQLLEVMPHPKYNEKVETDKTIRLIVEKRKINEEESLEIITERNVYLQYGDDVEIKVKNNGLSPLTLTANNGCAQFFEIIELKTGRSIPLYDKSLICTQAIKELTINPGETKIIGYWDKVDYGKVYMENGVTKKPKVDLGKYEIVVKDQSRIIDIIVYTY